MATQCVICTSKLVAEVKGSLDEQLDVVFFLTKLMNKNSIAGDVTTRNVMESCLQTKGNPVEWIYFCPSCLEYVTEGRAAFVQLKAFELKLANLKAEVAAKIVETFDPRVVTRSNLFQTVRGAIFKRSTSTSQNNIKTTATNNMKPKGPTDPLAGNVSRLPPTSLKFNNNRQQQPTFTNNRVVQHGSQNSQDVPKASLINFGASCSTARPLSSSSTFSEGHHAPESLITSVDDNIQFRQPSGAKRTKFSLGNEAGPSGSSIQSSTKSQSFIFLPNPVGTRSSPSSSSSLIGRLQAVEPNLPAPPLSSVSSSVVPSSSGIIETEFSEDFEEDVVEPVLPRIIGVKSLAAAANGEKYEHMTLEYLLDNDRQFPDLSEYTEDKPAPLPRPLTKPAPKPKLAPKPLPVPLSEPIPAVENTAMRIPRYQDKNRIKRPLNAFMVWSKTNRRKIMEENVEVNHSLISRELGKAWKALTEAERQPFYAEAQRLLDIHQQTYPNYKYQPQRRKPLQAKLNGLLSKRRRGPVKSVPSKITTLVKRQSPRISPPASTVTERQIPHISPPTSTVTERQNSSVSPPTSTVTENNSDDSSQERLEFEPGTLSETCVGGSKTWSEIYDEEYISGSEFSDDPLSSGYE